jgi:hypothetical protein
MWRKYIFWLIACLLPLVHSPWAFIQTPLNWLLFLYNSYFKMTSRLQKLLSLSLPQLILLVLIFLVQAPILFWSPLQLGFTWSPYWIGLVLAWCSSVYVGLLSEENKISSAYPMPFPTTFAFPNWVTLNWPYPKELPGRVTPYRQCPGTFYSSRYLANAKSCWPNSLLVGQIWFTPYPVDNPFFTFTSPLPDLAYLAGNPFFALSECDFTSSLSASYPI